MIESIGIHSDSWCSIFPHPKEIIKNDINNYVCLNTYICTNQQSHTQIEQDLNGKNHRFIQIAPYTLCKDTAHLEKIFQDIMDQGGEGIILRDPASPFQSGRSTGFLKHKVTNLYSL